MDNGGILSKPQKVSGTFGTPQAELLNGNIPNAKVSCIQASVENGESIPNIDDSSVWEFATSTGSMLPPALNPAQLKISGSAQIPAAFAVGNSCNIDIRHSACVGLLSKSTTEVSQAYYNSALNADRSAWDEVVSYLGLMPLDNEGEDHPDVVTAIRNVRNEIGKEFEGRTNIDLGSIENQDPLLVATQLLIQRIDQSLARGDKEDADKAKSILKNINPSAAYAVSCVLSNVKLGGLNKDLDSSGRPHGSYFGPLSGLDYGNIGELKTHGNFVAGASLVVGLIALGISAYEGYKADQRHKEVLTQQKLEALHADIDRFRACKTKGCEALYPEAKAAIAKADAQAAKEAKATAGTAGPERPIESDPDGIRMPPMIITAPQPGSGGNGGELASIDPTPSGSDIADKVKKDRDWNKHVDFAASQRFCEKVVSDYKVFAIKKVTNSGRPVDQPPSSSIDPIPLEAFGLVQYDKWTPAYWSEKKKNRESDPAYRAAQNNCHAMEEAQGL